MSARDTLTPELRAEVLRLEDDLRARVESLPEVQSAWREEYDAARAAERTAAAWEAWVDERVTLAAVAWVLTTVFIRFCEDNGLVKPVWISGPRTREALEAQQQFLRETARANADVTDREWLLTAVDHLKSLPATLALVDETSPMWLVSPSGDAATRMLSFWRERDDNGKLLRDLADADLDTRFLGDLYQEISEDAKKRYALLQTPVFVEEFILDQTLEPALNERPLEGFKMIDPTCGSGHFLLGGFQRLLDRWHKQAPGLDERERVQAALDSVHGVDINPFAVAIARFRLTVSAMQACGLTILADAPAFKYHLAAGDSLLHGLDQGEFDLGAAFSEDRVAAGFAYATENLDVLRAMLRSEQYDVVVGNPPYIQVKDSALRDLYRREYRSCKGRYVLSVPFAERFFRLAKDGELAGWTGQITSNSFMKREFGESLIEEYLPLKDVRIVVDSEGAWIPGHNTDGTPTVILIGRNTRPATSTVRAVLSKSRREGPSNVNGSGPFWRGIVEHLDEPGYESDWISVVDLPRERLSRHPWSLAGGGAVELMAAIEATGRRLSSEITDAGITAVTGEDDFFMTATTAAADRLGWPHRVLVEGDLVRDWIVRDAQVAGWPYDEEFAVRPLDELGAFAAWLKAYKFALDKRKRFGVPMVDRGAKWWEWQELYVSKLRRRLSITWAEVATHNHFVLDRGGKIFKQTAPVVKLSAEADEEQHVRLLGVLNSSTVGFWLKQVVQPKGGAADTSWLRTYQFNGTNVQDIPLPTALPVDRARALERVASRLAAESPAAVVTGQTPSRSTLDSARERNAALLGQMITLQEELDWEVYRLYGLIDEDLTYQGQDLPDLSLGERSFEISLARRVAVDGEATTWFARHGSKPIVEPPSSWPQDYRDLVERRIEFGQTHAYIRLLEKPDHKRRWGTEPWEKQEERALRRWLLDRLEARRFWFDQQGRPTVKSIAVLGDEVARDHELSAVLGLWEGRVDVPASTSLEKLLGTEAVPYLASMRYKDSGLRKRAAWEATWELQRGADAGTYNPAPLEFGGDGPIPVPTKYTTADFKKVEYWSHRGKLDLPNEPFILYPGAGREGDPTPVLGWAGWDHANQALALAALIQSGEQQGWAEERLIPLVAGLCELLPWVEQWHADPDPLYGGASPAEFFSGLLDNYMVKLGATRESLAAWRPPAPTRGRKAKS